MKTVNIHEAKTHLSRLIDAAVKGEPFVIAKAGKPLVKVTAIDTSEDATSKRFGFMVISIAWVPRRSSVCSGWMNREVPTGHAPAALGGGASGHLAGCCSCSDGRQ
jgi:prevent-host-death family protein